MTYEFEGKTEKEAIEIAANELGLQRDQFDVEILESQKKTLFKNGYVKICVHTLDDAQPSTLSENGSSFAAAAVSKNAVNPVPQGEFEEKMVDFVKNVIEKMGYEVKVELVFREEKKIGIKLDSQNSSILIGRKGKNLDALQLLANIYAGRLGHEEIRVILDTENYRIRREESLVRLAYTTADKVHTSHKSILLEPMNPFERRIIHSALQNDRYVTTHSEGDEPYRHVVVTLKR